MYNGIGLSTTRGSATSGHVTKNLSYVKPDFFRKKISENSGQLALLLNADSLEPYRKINNDIVGHKKQREIEAQYFEIEVSLIWIFINLKQ